MKLLSVEELETWRAREQTLLWPGLEISADLLEQHLASEFHEIGASGKRLGRQFGLDTLNKRRLTPQAEAWGMTDLLAQQVRPGVVLLSYKLKRGERESMRSTLWRQNEDGLWEAVFHQGTPVP